MGRRKFVLRSKLIKTERIKVLPASWKEKGFKEYTNKWEKTGKVIFVEPKKGSYICGNGLAITVKTYQTEGRKEFHKALFISCLCCIDKKEKDKFSIYLPSNDPNDRCMEVGGAMSDIEIWKRILLPIFGLKVKGAIEL